MKSWSVMNANLLTSIVNVLLGFRLCCNIFYKLLLKISNFYSSSDEGILDRKTFTAISSVKFKFPSSTSSSYVNEAKDEVDSINKIKIYFISLDNITK